MADGFEIKLEGLDELIEAFAKLPDEAAEMIKPAVEQAGKLVLEKAKEKVPVDSGKLRDSLRLKKARQRPDSSGVIHYITWGPNVREYAAPLELGHAIRFKKGGPTHGRVAPRPYLRPAADESKEQVLDIVAKAMNRAIDEMGGRESI